MLIMEDDAFVVDPPGSRSRARGSRGGRAGDTFMAAIRNTLDRLPADADILYLGHAMVHSKAVVRRIKSGGLLQSKYLWQLHGYMITRHTARLLLNNLPVCAPVDNHVAGLIEGGVLTAYCLEKQLCRQPLVVSGGGAGGVGAGAGAGSDFGHGIGLGLGLGLGVESAGQSDIAHSGRL